MACGATTLLSSDAGPERLYRIGTTSSHQMQQHAAEHMGSADDGRNRACWSTTSPTRPPAANQCYTTGPAAGPLGKILKPRLSYCLHTVYMAVDTLQLTAYRGLQHPQTNTGLFYRM